MQKKKYLLVLAIAAVLCAPSAANGGTLSQTIAASNLRSETATSTLDVPLDANAQSDSTACEVLVAVQVPHNKQSVDKLMAYPFPVRPPATKPLGPLYDDLKNLKLMALNLGYTQRRHHVAYPAYGWRFENAFKAAMARSGLDYPHHMIDAYRWSGELSKYLKKEVDRINIEEDARAERYTKAAEHWETEGVDIESEATRRGLMPVAIHTVKSLDRIKLEPGSWWITGTRKVPGLLYYWQLPVTITAGESPTIKLTQENALFIQGAW